MFYLPVCNEVLLYSACSFNIPFVKQERQGSYLLSFSSDLSLEYLDHSRPSNINPAAVSTATSMDHNV
jgi:hypothetical protein